VGAEEGWVVCSSDSRVVRSRRILLLGRARAAQSAGGSRVMYWIGMVALGEGVSSAARRGRGQRRAEGKEERQQAIMGQSGAGVRERGARSLTAGGGGESVASVRRRG
jgi:hypothetical protein